MWFTAEILYCLQLFSRVSVVGHSDLTTLDMSRIIIILSYLFVFIALPSVVAFLGGARRAMRSWLIFGLIRLVLRSLGNAQLND